MAVKEVNPVPPEVVGNAVPDKPIAKVPLLVIGEPVIDKNEGTVAPTLVTVPTLIEPPKLVAVPLIVIEELVRAAFEIPLSVPPNVRLPDVVTVPVKVKPLTVPVPLTLVTVPTPDKVAQEVSVPLVVRYLPELDVWLGARALKAALAVV